MLESQGRPTARHATRPWSFPSRDPGSGPNSPPKSPTGRLGLYRKRVNPAKSMRYLVNTGRALFSRRIYILHRGLSCGLRLGRKITPFLSGPAPGAGSRMMAKLPCRASHARNLKETTSRKGNIPRKARTTLAMLVTPKRWMVTYTRILRGRAHVFFFPRANAPPRLGGPWSSETYTE